MRPAKPKPWLAITLIIFFIVLALVIWKILIPMYFPGTLPSYAQEVAKPFETALANAGAVSKCGNGDNGRGSDNSQPHYGATFELREPREQAIATINKIAADNGYKLTHASIDNRGSILADDKYIDNWFYDSTSKSSPYGDLESGKVEIFFVLNNDGDQKLSEVACGTDKPVVVSSGVDVTAVNIQVKLPLVKR